jgi:uncharacterized protein
MTDQNNNELLTFPCEFHYKVVGDNTQEFSAAVKAVFNEHFYKAYTITEKPSKNAKFVAFNVAITATSREQLDSVYKQLHALPGVQIVL